MTKEKRRKITSISRNMGGKWVKFERVEDKPLSEMYFTDKRGIDVICKDNVKEAVERLKKRLLELDTKVKADTNMKFKLIPEIDKIFGEFKN